MAHTKKTAKKSSGGKAPHTEITSPHHQRCVQQAKAQQIKEYIKNSACGKAPTIIIPPMKRAPTTTLQLSGPMAKLKSKWMPLRKLWDHGIDLKEDFPPKKGQLIPLLVDEQKEVEAFLDDQLSKGYIRPSNSQQTFPVFFVPKKDGKKHMVQDYHYLNEWTIKNNYLLPLISQLVDKLKGCKLFTTPSWMLQC